MTGIAIRLEGDQRSELEEFLAGVNSDAEVMMTRPFDGETAVQAVVLLSSVSFPFFQTWLRRRAEARKAYRIVVDGTELTGYSSAEVERILTIVQKTLPPSDGDRA